MLQARETRLDNLATCQAMAVQWIRTVVLPDRGSKNLLPSQKAINNATNLPPGKAILQPVAHLPDRERVRPAREGDLRDQEDRDHPAWAMVAVADIDTCLAGARSGEMEVLLPVLLV